MKLLITSLVFLSSGSAMAVPAVGDDVIYDIYVTTNGSALIGTYEISLIAYDKVSDSFTERTEVTDQNGKVDGSNQMVKRSSLFSASALNQIPTLCQNFGGTPDVVTLPAGIFKACYFQATGKGNGGYWLGAVPFALLQENISQSNGDITQLKLRSFALGD